MKTSRRAFTLIELLVVLAVIAILTALTVPTFTALSKSSSLNRGGQLAGDLLSFARQDAVTKTCDVEVRFYNLTSGAGTGWKAMQLWEYSQTVNGPTSNAASRVVTLPDGVVIGTDGGLSPMLSSSPHSGTVTLPTWGSTSYRSFRFRPNGAPESAAAAVNYFTLVPATDATAHPVNYYTIQVDSLTGKIKVIRP